MDAFSWSGLGVAVGVSLWYRRSQTFELQAAKEILAEIYDIQIWEKDELIQQRIVDFS